MLWGKSKSNDRELRRVEEKLYEQVANEIKNGEIRDGLWLKAYAEASGEKPLAEAYYAKLRVIQLLDELLAEAKQQAILREENKPPSDEEIKAALKKADEFRDLHPKYKK